jgi:molybdopterin synthase catalytic subunit
MNDHSATTDETPDWVAVTPQPIDPAELIAHVGDPGAGATVMFLGTVRDHSPARGEEPPTSDVTHLEYEAYDGVVVAKIAEIVAEARDRWPLVKVAALHRTGELGLEEVSVAVAVSSAHRKDAFPACRYLIDELKHRAPIWKKEHWPGGAVWVREDEAHAAADDARTAEDAG